MVAGGYFLPRATASQSQILQTAAMAEPHAIEATNPTIKMEASATAAHTMHAAPTAQAAATASYTHTGAPYQAPFNPTHTSYAAHVPAQHHSTSHGGNSAPAQDAKAPARAKVRAFVHSCLPCRCTRIGTCDGHVGPYTAGPFAQQVHCCTCVHLLMVVPCVSQSDCTRWVGAYACGHALPCGVC